MTQAWSLEIILRSRLNLDYLNQNILTPTVGVNVVGEWTESLVSVSLVLRYGWVPHKVRNYVSSFTIFGFGVARRLQEEERACHGKEGYTLDFFYAYTTIFLTCPFDCPFLSFRWAFSRKVAFIQLHPNRWAFMQALVVVYKALDLIPTPTFFLYFFILGRIPTSHGFLSSSRRICLTSSILLTRGLRLTT